MFTASLHPIARPRGDRAPIALAQQTGFGHHGIARPLSTWAGPVAGGVATAVAAAAGASMVLWATALAATAAVTLGQSLMAWQRRAIRRAVENERLLMARELHDGPAQTVAVFVHRAYALAPTTTGSAAYGEMASAADELASIGERAMAELRLAIRSLQPPAPQPIGVLVAREAADAARGGTAVVDVMTEGDRHVGAQRQHLLRCITREAVGNAVRHSGAERVEVRLQVAHHRLRLRVIDDGRGFDTAAVRRDSVGLASMRWRARSNGGTLEIESRPGAGTVVTVVL